jgi:hypothetical protein
MLKVILLTLVSICLCAGCCATGADDTLTTQRATQLNLPGN